MKQGMAVALALATVLVGVRAGEEPQPDASVEKLIQEGLAAYKAGRHEEAIERLQSAIRIIQQAAAKGLASFLPPAPEGWKADAPESESGTVGSDDEAIQWTQVSRSYERESDELEVEITISNSPEMAQAQGAALMMAHENPQMLQMMNQDPDRKIALIKQDGWKGWTVTEKGDSAQTLAIHESTLVMVNVSGDDDKVRDTFWSSLDLKGIAAAGGSKK
ncbi:MAG: hypothetical protein ACYTFD_08765 [Planctomycetota bacterium]|jgi:hypothetical protein